MENEKSSFSDLYGTMHKSKKKSDAELNEPMPWVFFGSDLKSYESDFKEIMPRPIKEEAALLREKGMPIYACDIMGPGTALRDLSPDKGLALTLTESRLESDIKKDGEHNIELIAGDVLSKKTREKVDEWLKENTDGLGFNIALARPLEGLNHLTNKPEVWYDLVNFFWKHLNKQGGILYTQLPVSYKNVPEWAKVKEWVEKLKSPKNNIENSYFEGEFSDTGETYRRPALRLVKNERSPDDLPTL